MEVLNIADLSTVRDKAYKVRTKWFDLGISLQVDADTLESIRQRFKTHEECFLEMLTVWLKSSSKNKTWRALVKALRDDAVGYGQLADEIEAKYCLNEGREESEQGELVGSTRKRASSYCANMEPTKHSRVDIKPLLLTGTGLSTKQVLDDDGMISRKELQNLQQQYEQVQSELQQTKRDHLKENELQNANIQRLKAEAQGLQKQLTQQQSQASTKINKLETENQKLQSELAQQRSSQQRLVEQAVQSTRQKVKDLEKEVSALKQQLATSRQGLEGLLEQVISTNVKGIKEAEKSVSEYKTQMNELKKKGQLTVAVDDKNFKIQCQELHTIKELFTRDECDVAVDGEKIYIYNKIDGLYSYCAKSKKVQQIDKLTTSTNKNPAFAVIDHKPTLIGGRHVESDTSLYKDSNTLLSLTDQIQLKWEEIYPTMPTARSSATAVTTRDILIVAGGEKRGDREINSIEIMDIVLKQWSTVCGLPFSAIKPQVIIYGERVFVSGMCRADRVVGDAKRNAICMLDNLVNSSNLTFTEQCEFTWNNIKPVPFNDCTCAGLSGRLLAFGG